MSFRLVGTGLLERWYEVEPDSTRHVLMNDWRADLLDDPWQRTHDAVPGPSALLRVAVVPDTSWAVRFLINDGERQIALKGFMRL